MCKTKNIVDKYPDIGEDFVHTDNVGDGTLQTTSYNFTGTETIPEQCVGVVKAAPLFPKNPAQHGSDFNMLKTKEDLKNYVSYFQWRTKEYCMCACRWCCR